MKKNYFKSSQKLAIREFHKLPYENPIFSLGQFYQKFFYTLITLVVLHTEFGFSWTTPWPDENELFIKLAKKFAIREIRKIPYENPIFC